MKYAKNIPVFTIAGALIFFGLATSSNAQGATSVTQLEKRIKLLEQRIIKLESVENEKVTFSVPYLVESVEQYGSNSLCGSGKFRLLDSRGTAALMTSGNYRIHTCQVTFKANK